MGIHDPTKSIPDAQFPTWEEFEERLSRVLSEMAVDTFLVITARNADGEPTYWVQFAQDERLGLLAEAVGNRYLPGTRALSPTQEAQMGDLGWMPPTSFDELQTNFGQKWPTPAPFDEVARLAVRTLREVYGVDDTSHLAYKSFARYGPEIAQPALGIDAEGRSQGA